MISGKIYLVHDDNCLVAMEAAAHDSEDLLQGLLERHPDLPAGEHMNEGEPRHRLLIFREFAVPDTDGAAGRWSLVTCSPAHPGTAEGGR